MADEDFVEKTPLEKSRDIITQLKEMEHYARANIEKLSAHWLQLDDELKNKPMAQRIEELLSQQNRFHEGLEAAIQAFQAECDKQESAA